MRRLVLAAGLVLVLAAPARAQTLPPGAVAVVGDHAIGKREAQRWLSIGARAEYGPGAVLDAPRFRRCVAWQLRSVPRGERRPSRSRLKRRCERSRRLLIRRQLMPFLLQSTWIRLEAAAQGIRVSRSLARRSLNRAKRESFDGERDFRRFLRESGQTEADLVFRVRIDLLSDRLRGRAAAGAAPVTREEVDAYYAEHRRLYRGMRETEAKEEIRARLEAEREMAALDAWIEEYTARYRAISVCAREYAAPQCGG